MKAGDIASIGITNQRETTLLWHRKTGAPVHHAIVWQDRRTEPLCAQLRARDGLTEQVRRTTGLIIDPYFSGTKIRWLLDHVDRAHVDAAHGELAFGTIDSWLLWKLTDGRVHATDVSNASRTMLFDVRHNQWDRELLKVLQIPDSLLPKVHPSSHVFAETDPQWFGAPIPIAGIAGDQQSALFGQACFKPGLAKNTYGTGCFMLMHTGDRFEVSTNGLVTTSPRRPSATPQFALEGSVFIGGAVVQWLRDGLRAITGSNEIQGLAASVPDAGGVMFVPAFTGLGAPYWNADARGAIVGLTPRQHGGAHRARGAREHRVPERGAAAGDGARRRGRRRGRGQRAARRRRRQRQRPADAVPGRPARHPGGAAARWSRPPRSARPISPGWPPASTRTSTSCRRSGRSSAASCRRCRAIAWPS